jgi:hypothetical protein
MELELFHEAIIQKKDPPVTVLEGYNAMKVAYQILNKLAGDRTEKQS